MLYYPDLWIKIYLSAIKLQILSLRTTDSNIIYKIFCGKRKKTVHQDHTSIKGSDIFRLSCLLELKHTSVLGDIFSAQSAHFLRILNWNLEGSIKGSHITYKNISCYSNTITAKFRGARTEYHFTLSMLL